MSTTVDHQILGAGRKTSTLPRVGFSLFCLYYMTLVLLPGGSIFGLNLKVLVFLPVAFFAIRISLNQRNALRQLAVSAAMIAIFLLWIMVAQWYSFYDTRLSFAQYRDVSTTFAGCWFVRLYTLDEAKRRTFLRLCLYTVAFGGLLKALIFAYALSRGVSVSVIMDGIAKAFGVQLMTFDLGDAVGRIQYPSDTLVPVCLFAILCLRKKLGIGGFTSLVIVTCLLSSSIFTFSRFMWIYTVFGALLGLAVGKKDRMHLLYFAGTGAVVAYTFKALALVIGLRFSDQVVDSSDATRTEQKGALINFLKDAPFFGHGLGTYTSLVIRDSDLYYNYEMQVIALAGQVGIVGIALLLGIMVNYYRKAFSFRRGSRLYQVAVFLMLLLFLLSGFFNPYLVSSIASATFGMLFALAALGSSEEDAKLKILMSPLRN